MLAWYTAERAPGIDLAAGQPPDAILITDATWPSQDGFKALDDWPTMKSQIDCCFRLADSQTVTTMPFAWAASSSSVSWRLYVPRAVEEGRS